MRYVDHTSEKIFLKLLSSISKIKNSLLNFPKRFEFLIKVVATPAHHIGTFRICSNKLSVLT